MLVYNMFFASAQHTVQQYATMHVALKQNIDYAKKAAHLLTFECSIILTYICLNMGLYQLYMG